MAKPTMVKYFPNYEKNLGIYSLIFMKSIIWVTFTIDFCLVIFTPFSVLNSFILVVLTIIFIYFVHSQMNGVNFKVMKNLWYIYLNILVLAFIVRYFF